VLAVRPYGNGTGTLCGIGKETAFKHPELGV
jgi:hypothetical protein